MHSHRHRVLGWQGAALGAVAAIVGSACLAGDPPAGPLRWASRGWELNDVIPGDGAGGAVRGIVQADDGSLVVATTVGLVEFDGASFRRLPLPLPADEKPGVSHLARRPAGPLAVVLASGRVAWVASDYRSVSLTEPRPAVALPTSLAIDAAGNAWVADEAGGIRRVSPAGLETVVVTGSEGGHERAHLAADDAGTIWVSGRGSLAVIDDGRLREVGRLPGGMSVVAGARGGGAWATAGTGLFRFAADGTRLSVEPVPANFAAPPPADVVRTIRGMFEDPAGRLWLSSSRYGLFVLERESLTQVNIGETWISGAMHDRDGNIWAGTRLAIHRVQPAIAWPTPLPTWKPIVALCRDGTGRTWCLTSTGELGSWPDGRLEAFRAERTGEPGRVTALTADGAGTVWAALEEGRVRWFRDGRAATERLPPPHDGAGITAILATRSGDLWVATRDTLLRKRGESWDTASLPAAADGCQLAAGADGTIWLVNAEVVARVAAAECRLEVLGLPPGSRGQLGAIVRVNAESLWVGVKGQGLARWRDSRWSLVTSAHGLPSADIVGGAADDHGRIWFASPRMLFVATLAELEQVADGTAGRCHCWVLPPRHETDFLESLATPVCAMLPAADGRLLAARQSGLVICDPARLPVSAAPPVAIRQVSSDAAAGFVADSLGPVSIAAPAAVLPPLPRRVQIDFSAATLRAPSNVLVEYRLEGIDDDWIQAPLHGRATYPTLPSGSHAFWLRSSGHASRWEPTEPAITIQVPPPFWETWWFRALSLATSAGLAAAVGMVAIAIRARRRLVTLREQAAVDRERMRLARDMHDEVGTNLTQIALLTEVALGEAGPPLVDHLETVARISRQTVSSLDELVWAVDPGNDTLPHLLSYVCRYASETLREFGIQCDVAGPGELPAIVAPGDFRRGVLLIMKEAITNVVAHARATRVSLRLAVDAGSLVIEIADDGQGADGGVPAGGAGQGNMRHRAETLGGTCRIGPGPLGGTSVLVELPLAAVTEGDR